MQINMLMSVWNHCNYSIQSLLLIYKSLFLLVSRVERSLQVCCYFNTISLWHKKVCQNLRRNWIPATGKLRFQKQRFMGKIYKLTKRHISVSFQLLIWQWHTSIALVKAYIQIFRFSWQKYSIHSEYNSKDNKVGL